MEPRVRVRTRPSPRPDLQSPVNSGPDGDHLADPLPAPASGPSAVAGMSVASDNSTYEVGYGRPPKAHQFRKGNRANPRGRPKGSKSFLTIVRETLEEKVPVKEGGRVRKMTKGQIGIKKCVNRFAETGDLKHLTVLLQYFPHEPGQGARSEAARSSDPSTAFVIAYLDQLIKEGGTLTSLPEAQSGANAPADGGHNGHAD